MAQRQWAVEVSKALGAFVALGIAAALLGFRQWYAVATWAFIAIWTVRTGRFGLRAARAQTSGVNANGQMVGAALSSASAACMSILYAIQSHSPLAVIALSLAIITLGLAFWVKALERRQYGGPGERINTLF